MKTLINIMNQLNDMDWSWWPLLRCRPVKDQPITTLVVLKMTPVFGTLTGILVALAGQFDTPVSLLASLTFGWVSFFLLFRISFAAAWNHRAQALRATRPEADNAPDQD